MVEAPVLLIELGERDLDRPELVLRRHEERPQERVPGRQRRDQGDGDEGRANERQRDAPQEAGMSGAVERRRVLELLRDTEEELAEQEDREDRRRERDDLDPQRVVQPEAGEGEAGARAL